MGFRPDGSIVVVLFFFTKCPVFVGFRCMYLLFFSLFLFEYVKINMLFQTISWTEAALSTLGGCENELFLFLFLK